MTPSEAEKVSAPSSQILCELGSRAECDDAWNVFSAGAALALVRAPVEERGERHALAHEESSGTLWRVHFVARDGEQINVSELAREIEC